MRAPITEPHAKVIYTPSDAHANSVKIICALQLHEKTQSFSQAIIYCYIQSLEAICRMRWKSRRWGWLMILNMLFHPFYVKSTKNGHLFYFGTFTVHWWNRMVTLYNRCTTKTLLFIPFYFESVWIKLTELRKEKHIKFIWIVLYAK